MDMTATYKEEVLGQRVSILFVEDAAVGEDDNAEKSTNFYSGSIIKMVATFDPSSQNVSYKHFVLFDDDETLWFDLCVEEEAGRLVWPKTAAAAAVVKKEDSHTASAVKREECKIAIDDEVPPHPVFKKMKHEEGESPDKMDGAEQADCLQEEVSLPDPLPSSIDGIIRLMDKLEPDQGYFDRQADSRGGCSGTRGKLRKFARKNPGHAAVRHWVETSSWQPPNETAFRALVELLKTMIK